MTQDKALIEQHAAASFIENELVPAEAESADGGLTLYRAIVAHIFADAAAIQEDTDINLFDELLALAKKQERLAEYALNDNSDASKAASSAEQAFMRDLNIDGDPWPAP